MRALFVAPYLPTPGSGGRTRLVNFMQRLSHTHELRIVAFAAPDQTPDDNPYEGTVLASPPKRPRPGGLRGTIQFYRERLGPLPQFVSWVFTSEMAAAVRAECERFKPDVVQIETTEMAQYLRAVPHGVPRALDLQDVASRWFARVASQGETAQQRRLMRLELRRARRYDRRSARDAEVVFATSPEEIATIKEVSGVEAVEVPNGVDTYAFTPMPVVMEDPNTVLFVGPLGYDPNGLGLQWFAENVLPLIVKEVPDAVVEQIGTTDGVEIPGVRSLGRVDDVRLHLARAPVSIVPVHVGSGTRYKILEALSMGRAVVSTSVGAEGLGVVDDEHILIADEPEGFARAVVRLLRDPALRARLGTAGRAHVVARFDWGPIVERIEQAWQRITAAP